AYDLKQPNGCTFNFTYPGAPATLKFQTEDPQLHENGTYSITSYLTVTNEIWESNKEMTCIFSSPGLTEPIIITISKITEKKMILPRIGLFPPPPEDIAKDELCTLTCVVYEFYPRGIYMGWTEDDKESFMDQHVNSEPKWNDRNASFSAVSFLSVPCSEWKQGKRYGCLVGHEAIALKFIRKEIDIHSGKPATVKVSVAMSDTTMSCY
ncbi:unnamed protein product, partial [Staurois parvus]